MTDAPTLPPPEIPAADPTPAKKPAKKATAKKVAAAKAVADTAPRGPGRPSNLEKLEGQLAEQFTTLGVMVMMANPVDGQAIVAGAPGLARSLVEVAKANPKVEKTLRKMVETSAWAGVIASVAAIAVPIAANHGVIPSSPMFSAAFGVPDPEPAPTS